MRMNDTHNGSKREYVDLERITPENTIERGEHTIVPGETAGMIASNDCIVYGARDMTKWETDTTECYPRELSDAWRADSDQ